MKFVPEDFHCGCGGPVSCESKNAALANRRLEQMLLQAPLVFGSMNQFQQGDVGHHWDTDPQLHSLAEELITHKARLVDIEEI